MNQKSLILLRGLPGSGKTSFASLLQNVGKFETYSLDEFFTNEKGEYHFDYRTNHLAYKQCEANVLSAMERMAPNLLVDQTFVSLWELQPYLDLAKEFDYRLYVCTMENRHAGENTHAISDEQLLKMAKGFKIELLPERLRGSV